MSIIEVRLQEKLRKLIRFISSENTSVINNIIYRMKISGAGYEYLFSEVSDGNMSLAWGKKTEVDNNKQKFLSANGLNIDKCVKASLMHGSEIKEVTSEDTEKEYECDSLLTSDKNIVLTMVTADCFPLVIFDPIKKLISLTHLGHRGASAKLPIKIVTKMVKSGAKPELLKVILGPGIRKESYVFESVNQKDDPEWKPFLQLRPKGLISVDLAGYILKQLKDLGVVSENITDTGIDTGSNPDYFSHFVAVKNDLKEGRFLSAVRLT